MGGQPTTLGSTATVVDILKPSTWRGKTYLYTKGESNLQGLMPDDYVVRFLCIFSWGPQELCEYESSGQTVQCESS